MTAQDRPTTAELLEALLEHLSPDCRDANHHKCDFHAWDPTRDELTDCTCTCHITKEDC